QTQAGGYNFGVHLPGSEGGQIQGTVYLGAPDGTWDPTDPGFYQGVTVFLDLNNDGHLDAGDPSMTPSVDGVYHFGNLAPGTYHVGLILAAGGQQTLPANNGPVAVTLNQPGQVYYGADFGVYLDPGALSFNAGAYPGLILRDPKTQQVYVQ